jgi:predicted TPR repeat methyltransferase
LSGALFRSHASALTGVDLSPEMISLAEKRGIYSSLHVAEITQWLKQDSASYNLILACDSLIYFGDLEQALKLASHRLKPGGLVAFTCETGSVMPFQLCDSGRYAHHPDHVHRAANGAGLSIVSLSECVLRQEYGESVSGLVTVAQAG